MGVLTSQRINSYYERFKAIDVTFSKEIIEVTGLITSQIYLKCGSDFWPCVIYSTSFQGAKVVSNIKSGILGKLRQANNSVNLRLCFKSPDGGDTVTFFVSTRAIDQVPYGNSADIGLFSLQFTQRPPDDMVGILGRLLDANVNFKKRREERILIAADTQRKLALISRETAVFIQGVPRRCILRDFSFSGAKLIMMGVAKFLEGREAALRLDFDDPRTSCLLKGKFIRSEMVEGRKDLVALALLYDDSLVPMGYKIRLSEYLNLIKPPSDLGAAPEAAPAVEDPPSAEEGETEKADG
jgi:hypothetical protein